MILDEPLTAMIPPPDLWGSTGYTANNNKVGWKKPKKFQEGRKATYFKRIQVTKKIFEGGRRAGGGLEQSLLCQEPRGGPCFCH